MKLQDSVIAITGGGQGLGRAMAEYLAAKGARLALIDLMPEKLEEAAAACKKAGGDARTYICNVAKEDDVEKTFEAIVADFGQLNGLINNAGILRDGLMVKVKDGQVEKRMDPVLEAFEDQVLFLKHNLNAQAIGSLQDELGQIRQDVDSLINEMEASIAESEAFIRQFREGSV